MDSVTKLMDSIVAMREPPVFRVILQRHDYTSLWTAIAILRGGHTSTLEYSTVGPTPQDALKELKEVLKDRWCRKCGRLIKEETK